MESDTLSDDELERMLYASSPFGDARGPDAAAPAAPAPRAGIVSDRRHLAPRGRSRRTWAWAAPVSAVALTAVIVAASFSAAWLRQPGGAAGPTGSITSPSPAAAPREGVVGTGTLLTSDGTAVGRVEVSMSDDVTRFSIRDYASAEEQLQVNLGVVAGGDDGCGTASNWELVAIPEGGVYTFAIPSEMLHGDPTAIDQIAIVSLDGGADAGCHARFGARAQMTWTIPPARSWLADIADAGARDGASGQVVSRTGGSRVYVVASGDRLDDVAARFGIRPEDLFYLNESRSPNPEDAMLYTGEELNLDLGAR